MSGDRSRPAWRRWMAPGVRRRMDLAMAAVVAGAAIYLLVVGDSRILGWSLLGVAALMVLAARFDYRDRHIRR